MSIVDEFINQVGFSESNLDYDFISQPLHQALVSPLAQLMSDARSAGFEMSVVSAYRSVDRQLQIWNGKASGQRAVLDSQGHEIDIRRCSPWQLAQCILRWSALPGASRHHWGTDVDVIDRAAVSADYQVQLTPDEVGKGGPFDPLHCWLDQQISKGNAHGFFRPYSSDTGGIAPERWHLSYAPVAALIQRRLTRSRLKAMIESSSLLLKDAVLEHFDEIYERYIWVSAELYPEPYREILGER